MRLGFQHVDSTIISTSLFLSQSEWVRAFCNPYFHNRTLILSNFVFRSFGRIEENRAKKRSPYSSQGGDRVSTSYVQIGAGLLRGKGTKKMKRS